MPPWQQCLDLEPHIISTVNFWHHVFGTLGLFPVMVPEGLFFTFFSHPTYPTNLSLASHPILDLFDWWWWWSSSSSSSTTSSSWNLSQWKTSKPSNLFLMHYIFQDSRCSEFYPCFLHVSSQRQSAESRSYQQVLIASAGVSEKYPMGKSEVRFQLGHSVRRSQEIMNVPPNANGRA